MTSKHECIKLLTLQEIYVIIIPESEVNKMRFYLNIGLGALCAEEDWVVWYLLDTGEVETEEEALQGLRTCREFCGWIDCDVTDTIRNKMEGVE